MAIDGDPPPPFDKTYLRVAISRPLFDRLCAEAGHHGVSLERLIERMLEEAAARAD
jgi:predicted HicB family RNase H-like nuclease